MPDPLDSDPLAALEQLHAIAGDLEQQLEQLAATLLEQTRALASAGVRIARLEELWEQYPDLDSLDLELVPTTRCSSSEIEPTSPDLSHGE
jgi:hypothetical protein